MNFIEKFKDLFSEKNKLINENMKIRKGKFEVEQKFNDILLDLDLLKDKYIDLLEKKSAQFDLYIKYQNQCLELSNEKRDLRKKCAELKEEILIKNEQIKFLQSEVEKNSQKSSKKNLSKKMKEVTNEECIKETV